MPRNLATAYSIEYAALILACSDSTCRHVHSIMAGCIFADPLELKDNDEDEVLVVNAFASGNEMR